MFTHGMLIISVCTPITVVALHGVVGSLPVTNVRSIRPGFNSRAMHCRSRKLFLVLALGDPLIRDSELHLTHFYSFSLLTQFYGKACSSHRSFSKYVLHTVIRWFNMLI